MDTAEIKNLKAQNQLMSDIISNYEGILYHVQEKGKQMRELMQHRKRNKEDDSVTYTKEEFDKLDDLSFMFKDDQGFHKLGIMAERGMEDNAVKIPILKMLK